MHNKEFKDRQLRYVELPGVFHMRASEINITCKQQMRICSQLAKRLCNKKSKDEKEFEMIEYLKDFLKKTSTLNEQVITFLDYLKNEIQEISNDAQELSEGAKALNIIRDQSEVIQSIQAVRDNATTLLLDQIKINHGKNNGRKDTANS